MTFQSNPNKIKKVTIGLSPKEAMTYFVGQKLMGRSREVCDIYFDNIENFGVLNYVIIVRDLETLQEEMWLKFPITRPDLLITYDLTDQEKLIK